MTDLAEETIVRRDAAESETLLELRGLTVEYGVGDARAVDGVDLHDRRGRDRRPRRRVGLRQDDDRERGAADPAPARDRSPAAASSSAARTSSA